MSSEIKPALISPRVEELPRVDGECSFTNSDCGAKNTTEHASKDVNSTTVSMCEPSKPGNTHDSDTQQAFRDLKVSQRHLRNITNQISMVPQPCSSKQSAKEEAIDDELKSKEVDRLLEELGRELDKLIDQSSTTLDSDDLNLSSDEEDLDETNKDKETTVASMEQTVTQEQLKSKKADRFLEEMGEEVSMGFGLPKTTTKENGTESRNNDPENANKAHNLCSGKLSNITFEGTCETSTSDGVHSPEKLTETRFRDSSEPSVSLNLAQTLHKLPASRFKAASTETAEQVSTTRDMEKEEEEEEKEKEEEEEEEFVKPPNWLDPQILRSVPYLKKATNPTKPCPPDTFFGQLHQNSPLAYTGYEKEPRGKKETDSPVARDEEILQAANQEVIKPLDVGTVKDSPPRKHQEKEDNKENKASEVALGEKTTMISRSLEEQRNKDQTLEKTLEKLEIMVVKSSEKAQEVNDSPREDVTEMKEVKEVDKTTDVKELKDSLSSLEMPHGQACSPVVKSISANEEDFIQSYSKDSPSSPVNDSISSPSKNTLPSPNKASPPSQSTDSPLYSRDSFSSISKDSLPLNNKDSIPLNSEDSLSTNSNDYAPSLSKDSPPSHSKHTTLSTNTDYPISHSKDSLHSQSNDTPPSPNKDSPASHSMDFPPSSSNFLPIQEQEEIIEQYDPEFPALVTPLPTKELLAGNLDVIRDMPPARANHMSKWLYSQSFNVIEYEQKVMEVLPEYSLIEYSDGEEDTEETEEPGDTVSEPAENLDAIQEGLQSLQLNEAIPKCCLTDSVFLVDKPKSAVSLGFKLPPMPLEDACLVKDFMKIRVTHVYTPFQFWFNFVDHLADTSGLLEMELEMANFYANNPDYWHALPRCLIKAGYICAIHFETGWRRARISTTPPPGVDSVSIYYLDYGYGVDVPAADLRYLPNMFGETPALAVRGTLSHIHPLGPHWSPDSMEQFKRLINGKEMFAHITELDLVERIVFLRISLNENFVPSVNKMLVVANLAGRSQHYDLRNIRSNFGRRHRYLRERLPSHEMLETRVFPVLDEEFEVAFDSIIYSPSFENFVVPRLTKGYAALRQALVAWMPAYRKEMEEWAVLSNEAKTKERLTQSEARVAWLRREEEERKTIEQERNRLTQKERMLKARKSMKRGTAEEKEVLLATEEEAETLKATDDEDETPQAGNMEEVD